MEIYLPAIAVVIAYIMDLLLGDPFWLPHPIVYFGKAIAWGEKQLNKGNNRIFKGFVMTVALVVLVIGLAWVIENALAGVSSYLQVVFVLVFCFFGLANKTLIKEGRMVFEALDQKGIEAGRRQLSRIVGRDPSMLNSQQIRTAVLETMAENLSDGVVAPLFWFAIGGIPGMMGYKMINTLDSMIGYKNERYLYFGRFAARLDDVANFIPARLTALLMVIVCWSGRAFRFIVKYGKQHSSPNAGYPEAALAGILNVRFGGPNVYHGRLVNKPYIGEHEKELGMVDYRCTSIINHGVCFISILMVVVIRLYVWSGI